MRRDRLYLFFGACYLAQGMTGLIYEPLSYLLKDRLGLGPAESAAFIGWMTLPLLAKPLFGLISDLLPLGGLRRRPHVLLACFLWCGGLLALAASSRPSYGRLLGLLILVNAGLVLSDVVCDAVMVERGKAEGKTGAYQAAQIGVLYATIVATGLGGGWLAAHASPRRIFALAAAFPLLTLVSVAWLREPRQSSRPAQDARALARFLLSRRFWAVSAFIFLWSFTPFLGTAEFYYESETLKLSPVEIGWLSTLGGLSGAIGAAAYARGVGVWGLRRWLRASVWIGAPLGLLYLCYRGPLSASIATAIMGLVGVGFRLALMDLAARCCPKGAEASGFAAFMSVFNLAASGSNMAGGWLLGALRESLPAYGCMAVLVLIGVLCTASCGLLLPAAGKALGDDAASA